MARDQCTSSRVMVVALVFSLLAGGMVGGARCSQLDAVGPADAEVQDVPMVTVGEWGNKVPERVGEEMQLRKRERRLATAMVWCVAKSNLSDAALQGALDWVCGPLPAQGQVNCFPVQSGQNCFLPDSVQTHASWAFNAYFQAHNATDDACDFQGTAVQVYADPSTSTCTFSSSTKEINGTISNGTITPPPPYGIFGSNSAATSSVEPQFQFHLLAAMLLLMTLLLT